MRPTSALVSSLAAITLLSGLAGCSRQDSPAGTSTAPVRLTYSVFFPPTHIHAVLATE